MPEKIRILYIIDHLHKQAGTESHLLFLLEQLDRQRFSCHVVAFDLGSELNEKIVRLGIPIFHLPVARYYTVNALRQAFRLRNIIKKHRIDIVQTFHFKSDVYGALVAYFSGIRCIISSKRDVGDLKSDLQFFLNRQIRRIIRHYIVVAKAVSRILRSREKVDDGKLQVIYNGVDTDRFRPPTPEEAAAARRRLGLGKDDFVLGMVAIMRPEKNHDHLFSAFQQALKTIPHLKLVLVGGGDLFSTYQQYILSRGLEDKVVFTGLVSDTRPFLRAFDVACLVPGSNEGFSNAVIEKMAMGLPLIVTDVGGNAEAVINDYNGIVIPPDRPDLLGEAIIRLHDNPQLRRTMGRRSLQRVRKEFTLEKMIRTHEHLYTTMACRTA